ncbi:aminomethyl-transferring glycine dehydrogenase subunit GcvPA [Candidatus Woesearchaeota archaeon]|nr:aminomethyl-transferring glycine dehydrogenase subunit GcvPA [Candidatus Woesearchaeota archaeon]
MNFIPNTDKQREDMLKVIGVDSVSELFKDIPGKILLKEKLKLSDKISEVQLKKGLVGLSEKNNTKLISFLGAGAYNHFIPSIVNHIISRAEFYTAYTPYQPEISQGILQAVYEYQTMICNLTGMDVANASMYDGASALAESCIMAVNITKRDEIVISSGVHPEYKEVVKTYCNAHGFGLVEIDIDSLKEKITEKTAAVLVQNPNFFGCVENLRGIENIAHAKRAIFVVCVVEATSLGLFCPGELGADIVVGEGQSFGNAISFGGPYLGIMAAKEKYARQLPGRIVGATVDSEGKKGYILTLQAREQHIRREKASSNICSNEALCALAATVYLATLGKNLKRLAELNLQKAHYLADKLKETGFELLYNNPFYNEFAVKVKDAKKVYKKLLKKGFVAGYVLGRDSLLLCVTEMNTKEDIDKLIGEIKDAANL